MGRINIFLHNQIDFINTKPCEAVFSDKLQVKIFHELNIKEHLSIC
jgi:hypothetical protein